MVMRNLWRRMAGAWSAEEETEAAARPLSEETLHQQRLRRLLKQGMPAWSELPPRCDACGRQLLTGELATIVRHAEELVLSCPLCTERLLDAGGLAQRAPAERERAEDAQAA